MFLTRRLSRGLLLSLTLLALAAGTVLACPFCSAPSLTLSQQLHQSDSAVLVQWVGGEKADRENGKIGSTTYEVVNVVHDSSGTIKKGSKIELERYRESAPGDLFLLFGTKGLTVEWGSPIAISETEFNYVVQAPTKETKSIERLAYFAKFLENPDSIIADDAYGEFANADYKDIAPLGRTLESETIRGWIANPKTSPGRLGLYGLLLGLSGKDADLEFLKGKILEPSDGYRLGIDGLISGYLILGGDKSLAVIEDSKLKDKKCSFSETYAAMQAIRFMWTYGDGRIDKEHLRAAMRTLLDRPELADLVITDLGRWSDWSVLDKLMTLYTQEAYDIPSIKRAIVRFYLVAESSKPKDPTAEVPEHVKQAKKHLAQLRKDDPETVKAAEEFFFLNF
jgi:hypothetical protein